MKNGKAHNIDAKWIPKLHRTGQADVDAEGATPDRTRAAANEKQKHEKETANKTKSLQENRRISAKISEEVGSRKRSKVLRAGRAG